jgi:hypothetical protein
LGGLFAVAAFSSTDAFAQERPFTFGLSHLDGRSGSGRGGMDRWTKCMQSHLTDHQKEAFEK